MDAVGHILVVEDDQDINRLLCRILADGGYDARAAYSGSEGMLWAEKYQYDLILLDLMLPGLSGEEFIAALRKMGKTMPVIVLSAKSGVEERVNVLKLGADDFIPKPFDNTEVLARVEAQLRRSRQFSAPAGGVLVHGDLTLDREEMRCTAAGREVALTAREFAILALLMANPRKVFTREQLYQSVWGETYMGDDNTVNVHISNLRAKLGRADYIKTVWGIGFKLGEV